MTNNLSSKLGVDFSNRRRNKVAGVIQADTIEMADAGGDRVHLRLGITTTESLGNCPKYIFDFLPLLSFFIFNLFYLFYYIDINNISTFDQFNTLKETVPNLHTTALMSHKTCMSFPT